MGLFDEFEKDAVCDEKQLCSKSNTGLFAFDYLLSQNQRTELFLKIQKHLFLECYTTTRGNMAYTDQVYLPNYHIYYHHINTEETMKISILDLTHDHGLYECPVFGKNETTYHHCYGSSQGLDEVWRVNSLGHHLELLEARDSISGISSQEKVNYDNLLRKVLFELRDA